MRLDRRGKSRIKSLHAGVIITAGPADFLRALFLGPSPESPEMTRPAGILGPPQIFRRNPPLPIEWMRRHAADHEPMRRNRDVSLFNHRCRECPQIIRAPRPFRLHCVMEAAGEVYDPVKVALLGAAGQNSPMSVAVCASSGVIAQPPPTAAAPIP